MPENRRSDLSSAQKGAIVLSGMVQLGLLVAGLADIYRRPAEEIRGGKRLWTAVAFINYVGPISYYLFGRNR